jgi:hypothetical protein
MHLYSCSNFNPGRKDQPIAWAFFLISENREAMEKLDLVFDGYELNKWIEPGKWSLTKEVFWRHGDGIQEVQDELAFFQSQGDTIQWEMQCTPGLDYLGEEVETNFYSDPNEAMRFWVESVESLGSLPELCQPSDLSLI